MHRNVLLVPLLALGMSSACGGKGKQSVDMDELSSLEDQSPPPGDQQPEGSDDQPRVSDRLPPTTAGDSCESLCGVERPNCDPRVCVETCREGPGAYAECLSEWQALLVCAALNDVFCVTQQVTSGLLYALCQPEYVALLRCANSL